jgi:phage head maturation protease
MNKKPRKQQSKNELRTTLQGSRLEARAAQDGSAKKLKGYCVVFNSPTDIGDFTEIIARGSFTRTLREEDQIMLRER